MRYTLNLKCSCSHLQLAVCLLACVRNCVRVLACVHVVNKIPTRSMSFFLHLKPYLNNKATLFRVICQFNASYKHIYLHHCLPASYHISFSLYLASLLYHCGVIRSLKSRPYIERTFLRLCSNQPPPARRLGNRQPMGEQIREQRCSASVDCCSTV